MAEAKLNAKTTFEAKMTIELTESEARALNEMTKYGIKSFIEGYRKCLGSHYIDPHIDGLTSLFETIDKTLPNEIYELDKCKKAIDDIKRAARRG